MHSIKSAARILLHRGVGGTARYSLGRFASVRQSYGLARGLQQRLRPQPDLVSRTTCFEEFSPASAAASVRSTAVWQGLRLPEPLTRSLREFAETSPLEHWGDRQILRASEIRGGLRPDGRPAVLASVVDAEQNADVQRIVNDPRLREAVSRCLGYRPTKSHVRFMVSWASPATREDRSRAGQTIDYHFDVHDFNFVYVNIYLTHCDARSGAHAMILGSHVQKPVRWLFASARRTDDEIRSWYSPEKEIVIEGPAGSGFIQDSSCYHKALPPIDRDRYMFQIRYF